MSTETAGRSEPTPLPLDTTPRRPLNERAGVTCRSSQTSREDDPRGLSLDTCYRVTTSLSTW